MAASVGVQFRSFRTLSYALRLPFSRFHRISTPEVLLSVQPQKRTGELSCFLCGKRTVSTSRWLLKMKVKKPYVPSKVKHKSPVVKIWKGITVKEISITTERPIDDVYEAMCFVENCEQYDNDNAKIEDTGTIFTILRRLGYRGEVIASPEKQISKISTISDATRRPSPQPDELVARPPVVTIMGHVDHGKTTLLDSLRDTNVVEQEFGGITQHIGAFTVQLPDKQKITFLDTPGHAAFSTMRARGANITDIVVLVVAADDGVMEQTVESIRYAREAGVPIIVAINKCDKPKVDLEYVKKGLLVHGIQMDDEGGDVQYVCISALKGTNLDKLVDAILTQAELMEIKGDPKGLVEGVVIESSTDPHRGKLATALIQRGTLRKGAILVSGMAWAKVRSMFDEKGKTVQTAPPSTPVQVIGWRSQPSAGDVVLEVESERRVQEVIRYREEQEEMKKQKEDYEVIQQKIDEHLQVYKAELEEKRKMGYRKKRRRGPREKEYKDDPTPRLPVIIKGDVDGSVEAILDILDTYHSHQNCRLDLVHYGVGPVTENDVALAETFDGIIYSFHLPPSMSINQIAKEKNVEIKQFNVIYKLIDDIKEELGKRLPLAEVEEVLGEATVVQEFLINVGKKKVPIAGSKCTKGTLKKNALFRVIRDSITLHEGELSSMKHLKSEVESIVKNVECGLMLKSSDVRFQPGDILVCYKINKVPQETDWDPGF